MFGCNSTVIIRMHLAMEMTGCLLVCLFVSVASFLVNGAEVGHGQLCRSTERFLSCGGCQATCKDPAPQCLAVCRAGCYCDVGQVRNETGHCVDLSECPPVVAEKLQSSEPRHSDTVCPPDEEYRSCEPCNKTCDNPNPICPAQCARGCFCRDGLVRDQNGLCVTVQNCSNAKKNISSSNLEKTFLEQQIREFALELACGPHQTYSHCRSCERVCSSPVPVCTSPCNAGCFCEEGYLKAPSGQCVKLEDCPRAEENLGGASGPNIEDCSPDEIYLSCGWCEPSCWDPQPECPRGVCTRGCLCRPPFLRHHSGQCVAQRECLPHKCQDPNEEFVCRYGCEARCELRDCVSRPRHCVLGCHCKFGLLRNAKGKCVFLNECPERIYANYTSFNNKFTFSNESRVNKTLFNILNNANDSNIITFNLTNEEKLFYDVPKVNLEVVSLPGVVNTDALNPLKSVFDVPIDTTYSIDRKINYKDNSDKVYHNVISSAKNDNLVPKITENKVGDTKNKRNTDNKINKMSKGSRFFLDDKPIPESKLLNNYFMHNLFFTAMKGILNQPLNLTIINYNPLWNHK